MKKLKRPVRMCRCGHRESAHEDPSVAHCKGCLKQKKICVTFQLPGGKKR